MRAYTQCSPEVDRRDVRCLFLFQPTLVPPLDVVTSCLLGDEAQGTPARGNIVPVYVSLPADLITPVMAYLRVSQASSRSFLFESVTGGEKIGRYSFIGASE